MSKMEAAGELLPEELVLEILLHVSTDVAALFRCAVVCKRWLALVADHSFLYRRWPARACSLLGFVAQQQRHDNNKELLHPVVLPSLSASVLGSHRRSLASFIPGLTHGELDGAVPLTSRHGLLLVRLAPRASNDPVRLAVCNLLAGTCNVLPSLKRGVFSVNCAIITGADYQRSPLSSNYYSTFFKVLAFVSHDYRNYYWERNNLYTFSSVEPGWSEPRNYLYTAKWSSERYPAILQWRNKVVVCGGVVHWLMLLMSKFYILEVRIETDHFSLTELSIPKKLLSTTRYGGPTLFVTAAGSPSLLWLQVEGISLDMWTQADDGAWLHARAIELKPPKEWNPSWVHVWSGEKSGVLLITDVFECVHMVDVESGAMEDMSEQFQNSWGMLGVPMEIDWPTLFLSRLGGGKN